MYDHEQIRERLLQRRNELNRRIHHITDNVRHSDGPLPSDFSEQAVEREEEEVLDALGETGRRELRQINRTLARVDAGAYGTCAECGREIPEARLEILPHSELYVTCAERHGR
ncbi:MAG: TraR/DksA family transcriptional regulator [gamma proteobacterium symbiont of Phacoides pectinatus]